MDYGSLISGGKPCGCCTAYLLGEGTAPFQEKFLRLKSHAKGVHQEFFAYVYAHEKAIEDFARKEMLRDRNSLTAVEHLLASSRV